MALHNIFGPLREYHKVQPGTLRHTDELFSEWRTNHDLRRLQFYPADGALYTLRNKECLLAITREPQNVVLQDVDRAYRQLTSGQGSYFPDAVAAERSLRHEDTIIINLDGLGLVKLNDQYGFFTVNPKTMNDEQKRVVKRICGPDETNLDLNLGMFAEAGKTLYPTVLMPDFVRRVLKENKQKFLARASWLSSFGDSTSAEARDRCVMYCSYLRGMRKNLDVSQRTNLTQ